MNTRMTMILAGLIAATSCSIICGSGCDPAEVGECTGPGGLFGPCDDHLAFRCLSGLLCLDARAGSICVPPVNADQEAVDDCGALLGGDVRCSTIDGHCVVSCVSGPCGGDSVCDPSTRTCVYPHEAPVEQE